MFGYIVINKDDLKDEDYTEYHSYYCGLCKTLKDNYGYRGQISLSYDMTFLAVLLSSLYEPDTSKVTSSCAMHPLKKYDKYFNECIDYASKMTIILAYYKCIDDYNDDNNKTKQLYGKLLDKHFEEIKNEYPDKIYKIDKYLKEINVLEKLESTNIDEVSNLFGKVMGEVCLYKDDEWADELYNFGFFFGKFIYLLDAYDDIEKDIKSNSYNPFKQKYNDDSFEDYCYNILELMISKATDYYDYLPIVKNNEIIENILYSGVWSKYHLVHKKREDKNGSL